VHNRSAPGPNIMDRYSLQAMIRSCPASIRSKITGRWAERGLNSRGLLTAADNKIAAKECIAGKGTLIVDFKRKQSVRIRHADMDDGFKSFMARRGLHLCTTFNFNERRTRIRSVKKGTKCVILDGRDIVIGSPLGLMWSNPETGRQLIGKVKAIFIIYSARDSVDQQIVILEVL
jgi:hypothetical protein